MQFSQQSCYSTKRFVASSVQALALYSNWVEYRHCSEDLGNNMNNRVILTVLAIASVLTGCGLTPPTDRDDLLRPQFTSPPRVHSVLVDVLFDEQQATLPSNAVLSLRLVDLDADQQAELIAKSALALTTDSPYRMALPYDADKIKTEHRYALQGRIEVDGELWFANLQNVDPFPNHAPAVLPVPLDFVRQQQAAESLTTASSGASSNLKVIEFAQKPDIANTYWRLTELGNEKVQPLIGQQELYMQLSEQSAQVRGFAGCNAFFGRYQMTPQTLKFESLGATKKSCFTSQQQEQRFLDALKRAKRFVMEGELLKLFDDQQILLAAFSAKLLKP